ncbi:MAG: S26 family signal peptidase [Patescibacteria group bacterium]
MLLFSLFKIEGHSMEPTIKNGQSVLASSLPYFFSKPKMGDIVVFRKNERVLMKRITKIDQSDDGKKYFVKGDNEKDSMDSKRFGWISKNDIIGKVIYTF